MHTERPQIEQIVQRFGEVLKSKGIIPENIILFGSVSVKNFTHIQQAKEMRELTWT